MSQSATHPDKRADRRRASGLLGLALVLPTLALTLPFAVTAVAPDGVVAATFSVVSGVQITITVPAGATTGAIAATTSDSAGTSAMSFTVTVLPSAPSITKLEPASGKRGATGTIAGKDFGAARRAGEVPARQRSRGVPDRTRTVQAPSASSSFGQGRAVHDVFFAAL